MTTQTYIQHSDALLQYSWTPSIDIERTISFGSKPLFSLSFYVSNIQSHQSSVWILFFHHFFAQLLHPFIGIILMVIHFLCTISITKQCMRLWREWQGVELLSRNIYPLYCFITRFCTIDNFACLCMCLWTHSRNQCIYLAQLAQY